MSFSLKDQKTPGKGYWKMNSSVLNDNAYIKLIEQTVQRMEQKLPSISAVDWWDMFILVVRNKTINYSTQKKYTENEVKKSILEDLEKMEAIPTDLTIEQKRQYNHLVQRHKKILEKEIQGYQIRTRGFPKYEIKEPDIEFYAKLEKRSYQKSVIGELMEEKGTLYSDNENIIKIATEYYTKLYTPAPVHYIKQQTLLKNVDKKLTTQKARDLDKEITEKELQEAVNQLREGKSPGYDGITSEFYKQFWYLIKGHYLKYINLAKQTSFGEYRNISITTLIYKDKGEVYYLSNYRPISLINQYY